MNEAFPRLCNFRKIQAANLNKIHGDHLTMPIGMIEIKRFYRLR